ncbi:class D beta-lactamase [Azospirillum sp. TSO35-2]|uniref:class D beta-lactamase n=1 Tax=Azospirillum sp. TSO35-2 TaxID=716796 RepID=UPI000D60F891|nr:class D beta-lactamase [Azospirillum sp. TSO35-2]PWC32663.1 hypothetical protein TSO352_18665 [Azospirillum sp. TSO35-2]
MISRRHFNNGLLLAAGAGLLGSATAGRPAAAAARAANDTLTDPAVCTVIRDVESGETLHRAGPCDQRFSPCSTFKFALAIMGFDAGILHGPHDPLLPYRPELKAPEREHEDTDPSIWLRDSIIWYSRMVTGKLGAARLQAYVDKLDYGNRDVSGNPGKADGLTQSWLMSSLRISPDEQVRLLHRSLTGTLPVSAKSCDQTHASLPVFEANGGWTVRGKTGSGTQADASGKLHNDRPQGWFIGWAEKAGRRVVFARLEVADRAMETAGGLRARDALIAELPGLLARG